MGAKAVYFVSFGGGLEADAFEESGTGMLDLSARIHGRELIATERREAAGKFRSAVETEIAFQDWRMGEPVYEAETERPRIHRIGKPGVPSGRIYGFLARYAAWRSAFDSGDYFDAAELILRSTKLRPYLPILSSVAGKRALLVLGLHWLESFDSKKELRLAALLAGEPDADQSMASLVDFARPSFKARDVPAFRKELGEALEAALVTDRVEIVLGLVAENFGGRVLQAIRDRARSAREEGLRRSLVEGLSGTEERVRAWLEGHEFILAREPWNKEDPNAIAILLRKPGEARTWLAGYLRRGVAAMLAPMADRGVAFNARLFMLSRGECDLRVRAGPRVPASEGAT